MTKALAARLRELNEKATPGPLTWKFSQTQGQDGEYDILQAKMLTSDGATLFDLMDPLGGDWSTQDFEFIAAIVNNLPAILTALEEVEEMREALEAAHRLVGAHVAGENESVSNWRFAQIFAVTNNALARAALKETP